jgi:large subunit ribosomal protein L29
MSNKEVTRLRELSEQELVDELNEAKSELFNLKSQWKVTRQIANSARLKVLRGKIARVNTLLREREIKGEQ